MKVDAREEKNQEKDMGYVYVLYLMSISNKILLWQC